MKDPRPDKTSNREEILGSIMTAEEYAGREDLQFPYVFQIEAGGKVLSYFGSEHTYTPGNPTFSKIESAFRRADPDIVLVEGFRLAGNKEAFNQKVKALTAEVVSEKAGESGFALKLAVDKAVDWESPEPSDKELYDYLLSRGFSKEEVFAWDLFNILPQYNRQVKKDGFRKYAQSYLDRFKEATEWPGFDYSYEHAERLAQGILGRSVDVDNEPEALDLVDPIPWKEKKANQTVLNRVSEASSVLRDRIVVDGIADALQSHNRVFVVYGASHAVMQEPALRKLMREE